MGGEIVFEGKDKNRLVCWGGYKPEGNLIFIVVKMKKDISTLVLWCEGISGERK